MSPRPRSSSSMTSFSCWSAGTSFWKFRTASSIRRLGLGGRHAMRDPILRHGLRTSPLRAGRAGHRHHDRPAGADERDRAGDGRRAASTPGRASATTTPRSSACSPARATRRSAPAATSRPRSPASTWCRLRAEERAAHVRGERPGILGPTRWTDLHKPTIAAVNGVAYAGGLEWACWTDLCIADEHATFGVTCRRWNIGLGDGGTQRLPRIVGFRVAMELILTGRVIDAHEAQRIGLVNEVVPRGTCRERARELAHAIAALPQPAMRTDKEAAVARLRPPARGGPADRGGVLRPADRRRRDGRGAAPLQRARPPGPARGRRAGHAGPGAPAAGGRGCCSRARRATGSVRASRGARRGSFACAWPRERRH